MHILPLFHSFETSLELPLPGLCHNPADKDGHMPPDNARSADIHRDVKCEWLYRKQVQIQK